MLTRLRDIWTDAGKDAERAGEERMKRKGEGSILKGMKGEA